MIINGQMKKYRDSLAMTSEPILLSQCPKINMDLRGMMKYAKEKRKKVMELTEEEKQFFSNNEGRGNFSVSIFATFLNY